MAQLSSATAHNLSSMCCARAVSMKAEGVVVTLTRAEDHHMAPLRMGPGWVDAVRCGAMVPAFGRSPVLAEGRRAAHIDDGAHSWRWRSSS